MVSNQLVLGTNPTCDSMQFHARIHVVPNIIHEITWNHHMIFFSIECMQNNIDVSITDALAVLKKLGKRYTNHTKHCETIIQQKIIFRHSIQLF